LDGIDEFDDIWTICEIWEYLEFATDPISAILLEQFHGVDAAVWITTLEDDCMPSSPYINRVSSYQVNGRLRFGIT